MMKELLSFFCVVFMLLASFGLGHFHGYDIGFDLGKELMITKCERGYIAGFLGAGGNDSMLSRFDFQEACKGIVE